MERYDPPIRATLGPPYYRSVYQNRLVDGQSILINLFLVAAVIVAALIHEDGFWMSRRKQTRRAKEYEVKRRTILRQGALADLYTKRQYAKLTGEERRERRMAQLPGTLTDRQWRAALKHFRNRCSYCNRPASSTREKYLEKEHIVPVSWQGSSNHASNIIPACASCNESRSNESLGEWLPARFPVARVEQIVRNIIKWQDFVRRQGWK